MRLFKCVDKDSSKNLAAQTFQPIIVIDGKILRPVTQASTAFKKERFFVNLYTPNYCSISEMYEVAKYLSNTFRRMIHNEVAYEQRMDNLPSFVGVRNICFKPLNTEDLLPYISVQLDNVQAAVFIVRSWCKRMGIFPHSVEAVYGDKRGANRSFEINTHKSTPFYIETLLNEYSDSRKQIKRLRFGAAATIELNEYNYAKHLYPVLGVRCSQRFGTHKNVHTMRKIKRLYEAKLNGTLEQLRRNANTSARSVARYEYEAAKAQLQIANITRSDYGAAKLFGCGNRYARARNKYAFFERERGAGTLTQTQIESYIGDGLCTANLIENTFTNVDIAFAEKLGIELPTDAATRVTMAENIAAKLEQYVKAVEAQEAKLREAIQFATDETELRTERGVYTPMSIEQAIKIHNERAEEVRALNGGYNQRQVSQAIRKHREFIKDALTTNLANRVEFTKLDAVDIIAVVAAIKECYKVSIRKGQAIIDLEQKLLTNVDNKCE